MKKIVKKIIAVVLSVICMTQVSLQAFAVSFTGKSYVKEMIISYGKTPDDAKAWLKNNNYKIIDCNINEGADDTFSTKRAVYLGYKTTMDADKALTDMKLMNMKGNYSAVDYQNLLDEQRTNIRSFINDFIVAVSEYRANYKKGQARAVAAHDMLNLLYDDDTDCDIGDLLLEKIKEEYKAEDFEKLSKEEQAKHADMTTILMQSNATSVITIEQIISLATDDSDTVWTERYDEGLSYSSMLHDVMQNENLPVSKAAAALAARYDKEAKIIAEKADAYVKFLEIYTESGITLESSKEELKAYLDEHGETEMAMWYAAGTQYEKLKTFVDDEDISLIDVLTDDFYDVKTDDRNMLYPLVSVLTDGQKACLDYLSLYQIVAMGINDDNVIKDAMKDLNLSDKDKGSVSIYEGIDRSIFSEDIAMTSSANKLQSSTDKDFSTKWFKDGISTSTKVLYIVLGVSVAATIGAFITYDILDSAGTAVAKNFAKAEAAASCAKTVAEDLEEEIVDDALSESSDLSEEVVKNIVEELTDEEVQYSKVVADFQSTNGMAKYFQYAGFAMIAVSAIIMGISAWRTYTDLKAYYNTEFTPIPMHMVNQGVNENDEKVFTYYTAVNCNRQETQMVTDKTEILKSFGDINGDVGKQWVALYTTTDKAAGKPITTDFFAQFANTKIPNESTPLSLFGESSAQNLTNSKGGYTYADNKGGIYLFYGTDSSIFAGSAISTGVYALIAGGSLVVFGFASFFITKNIRNKKNKKENADEK